MSPRHWTWIASYFLFALFVAYFGLHCFRYPWAGDIDRHVASVASFYRSLSSPPHEAIAISGGESEVHTPYMLAIALAGRALKQTPFRALQLAGVANLLLYVIAIVAFFRTFSLTTAFPFGPVAFLAVSLFVRDEIYHWSSETSFAAIRITQAYPSFFAWGLALLLFALGEHFLRSGRPLYFVLILLGIPFLLISHPLTGSWSICVLIVLCVVSVATRGTHANGAILPMRTLAARAIALVGAVALSIFLAIRWPYFDLLRPGNLLGSVEGSTFAEHPFYDFRSVYLPALVASALFVIHRRHVFILAGFATTFAVLVSLRMAGWDYGNRYAFFMVFFAQVAVAEVMALAATRALSSRENGETIVSSWQSRALLIASVGGASILALTSSGVRQAGQQGEPLVGFSELFRRPSTHSAYYERFRFLREHLDENDVVLMPVNHSTWDLSSQTGARVIAAPFSYRIPDFERRVRDVSLYFEPTASLEERDAIATRYGVTAVLLDPSMQGLRNQLEESLGSPLEFPEGYVLFYTASGSRHHALQRAGAQS